MRLEDKTICEINIALSAVYDIHAKVEHNIDFIVSFCSSSGPSCRISETFRHLNTHLDGFPNEIIFIGPESDHWLCLSLTH